MTNAHTPHTAHEVAELLRSRTGRVRLVGSGSRQHRLPASGEAQQVSLLQLDQIHRLEPGDQTCSVGPGLRREVLDEALHRVGLELPCAGGGTVGGLFAHDPIGAGTIGGASPRSLLLGLEGVLADGTRFRSGAQVVKSVAGFDVHKLLVGSDGRLFAAVQLHLRLRPRPRAEAWFRNEGLDVAAACARFVALRALSVPPRDLLLLRGERGCAVAGRFAGRAGFVAERLRSLDLPEAAPHATQHLEPPAGGEVLDGIVLPSRVPQLLAALPAGRFLLRGDGRFEFATATPTATDAALTVLPAQEAHGRIVRGEPPRRGHGSPFDAGAQQLLNGLKRCLDPHDAFV